jgi:hypothetical protein
LTYINNEIAKEVLLNLSQLPSGIYYYKLNERSGRLVKQ